TAKKIAEKMSGNSVTKNVASGSPPRCTRCKNAGPIVNDANKLNAANPPTTASVPAVLPVKGGTGSALSHAQAQWVPAADALGSTSSNTYSSVPSLATSTSPSYSTMRRVSSSSAAASDNPVSAASSAAVTRPL